MPLHDPVLIETGLVAGLRSEHKPTVTIFRGIPFAASTAGENRWRAPQPAEPWSGVRDCTQFGPIAPQLPPGPLYWTEEPLQPRQGEDCLNLNLWTPARPEDLGQARYPVYVWIYGGKFLWGAGTDNNFDGTSLAAKGVLVVTFNYRLGILGWLAHPALSAESGHNASGNYGLLDQIACLRWIQRNIKAFGGDPGRVTIGGQSAGSACVGLHLYGPESKGLFHGAISQSSTRHPRDPLISCLAPSYRTKDQAESEGERVFVEKGARDVSDMRAMSLDKLLEGNHRDDTTMWGPPPFYRAWLDGWLFPRTYEEALLQGTMNDVPLLNGQNADQPQVIIIICISRSLINSLKRGVLFLHPLHSLDAPPVTELFRNNIRSIISATLFERLAYRLMMSKSLDLRGISEGDEQRRSLDERCGHRGLY